MNLFRAFRFTTGLNVPSLLLHQKQSTQELPLHWGHLTDGCSIFSTFVWTSTWSFLFNTLGFGGTSWTGHRSRSTFTTSSTHGLLTSLCQFSMQLCMRPAGGGASRPRRVIKGVFKCTGMLGFLAFPWECCWLSWAFPLILTWFWVPVAPAPPAKRKRLCPTQVFLSVVQGLHFCLLAVTSSSLVSWTLRGNFG